jgi:hypothetical protein
MARIDETTSWDDQLQSVTEVEQSLNQLNVRPHCSNVYIILPCRFATVMADGA